jgi:CRISPR-associated protein Csh2
MNPINKRSEILFLYDVKQCNPNGDPMDSNRPRIDEETGHCMVTDVRLKRTIRDFLVEKGYDGTDPSKDVFIRDIDGKPVTGEARSKSYANLVDFIQKFIDVRLFGGVSAPKNAATKTFNITGPVQFGMGRSLHKVKENFIKGTGAFATSETAIQRTFREEYNISYGLIAFHGVINENAAKHTGLSEADVEVMMEALWDGTKGLLSRSKKGHMPRLLVKITYNKPQFFIGDLVERLRIEQDKGIRPEAFSDVSDFLVDTTELNRVIEDHKALIEKVEVRVDERIRLSEPIKTL